MILHSYSQHPETLRDWSNHPLSRLISLPYERPREFWVLKNDANSILGRVGAGLSPARPTLGWIGFFDLKDPEDFESASNLLENACSFLKRAGATRAVGPLHLNTWLPYRFALPTEDRQQFIWEPSNPASYPEHWKRAGFKREMLYSSEGHAEFGSLMERLKPEWIRARDQGYSFRPIDPERLLDHELKILHRLSMIGFSQNHLFEPMPEALFRELYVPLAGKNARQNLSLSGFVLSPEGEEVGFSFSFIDSSQGDPKVVLKTATLLPAHRGKGLSNALFYETLHGLDPGIHREFVSALVKEGAQSHSYGKKHPRLWRHEYELLYREL